MDQNTLLMLTNNKQMTTEQQQALIHWIVYGKTGVSSKAMFAALMGVITEETRYMHIFDTPHDPSDFGRCYKLWKECNLTPDNLQQVADILPGWQPFVDQWDTLVRMYEQNDFKQMYSLMQNLVEQGRINAGWTKDNNGSWSFAYPLKQTTPTQP